MPQEINGNNGRFDKPGTRQQILADGTKLRPNVYQAPHLISVMGEICKQPKTVFIWPYAGDWPD